MITKKYLADNQLVAKLAFTRKWILGEIHLFEGKICFEHTFINSRKMRKRFIQLGKDFFLNRIFDSLEDNLEPN